MEKVDAENYHADKVAIHFGAVQRYEGEWEEKTGRGGENKMPVTKLPRKCQSENYIAM